MRAARLRLGAPALHDRHGQPLRARIGREPLSLAKKKRRSSEGQAELPDEAVLALAGRETHAVRDAAADAEQEASRALGCHQHVADHADAATGDRERLGLGQVRQGALQALLAEVRNFTEQQLLPEMRAVDKNTGFSWEPLSQFPGLSTAEDAEVVELAKALTGANSTGKVSFGTEAGLFQGIDIPTVVCGPGSIEQAHKPDEFIAIEQIVRCEEFIRRLIERLAAD